VNPTLAIRHSAPPPPTAAFSISVPSHLSTILPLSPAGFRLSGTPLLSLPFVAASRSLPIGHSPRSSRRARPSLSRLPHDSITWRFTVAGDSRTSDASQRTEAPLQVGAIAGIVAGSVALVVLL
jgi:hypothetical protein